jgi:hypothetical protein
MLVEKPDRTIAPRGRERLPAAEAAGRLRWSSSSA